MVSWLGPATCLPSLESRYIDDNLFNMRILGMSINTSHCEFNSGQIAGPQDWIRPSAGLSGLNQEMFR